MGKRTEIRDPIYGFIFLTEAERAVLDSPALQRLRDIHQCGMSHFVYPGASHSRLEHSLGVLELAARIYDIVTDFEVYQPHGPKPSVFSILPTDKTKWGTTRQILRMAALCHDIGHAPFSHTGEGVFPSGERHETMTKKLILSDLMRPTFEAAEIDPKKVAKIAVGPKYYREEHYTMLEHVVSEIITSDELGADRIDYLLRDSYHTGVAYGRFDFHRLIQSMRILPKSEQEPSPHLGIDEGGLHCVESLLVARYFIWMQVYLHDVRRAYDQHLARFIGAVWQKGLPVNEGRFLELSDSSIIARLRASSSKRGAPGHEHARRIANRQHFRLLYSRGWRGVAAQTVYDAACAKFQGHSGDSKLFMYDAYPDDEIAKPIAIDLPVYVEEENTVFPWNSLQHRVMACPSPSAAYVFVAPEMRDQARQWLNKWEGAGDCVLEETETREKGG